MTYLVFDSETQTHTSHKRKANPFNEDNYVVLRGWKYEGDEKPSWQRFSSRDDNYLRIKDTATVLVGHNIKFDLLYELTHNNPDLRSFFKRGGRIWCTQYAEYLLNAQDKAYHMCSMNSIAESYGGKQKVDGIKELWDAGVQTSDIDPDMLLDYLVDTKEWEYGDIGNTEKIYLGQLQAAKDLGMYQAMLLRMDGLACTTEMEYNGLKIDVGRARTNLKKLTADLEHAEAELSKYSSKIPEEVGFNWGSNSHKSCIIFGGTIKYKKQDTYIDDKTGELARRKEKASWPLFDGVPRDPKLCAFVEKTQSYQEFGVEVPTGYTDSHGNPIKEHSDFGKHQDRYLSGKKKGEPKFKNVDVEGELKTKYHDFFYELDGYTKPNPEWKGSNTDGMGNPLYSVGSDVIDKITKRDIPFLKTLGRFTDLNKEIGTYYVKYDTKKKAHVGMLTCVEKGTHVVHHSLNHVNTVTSRLSSNNPNMQNIPRGDKSDVKALFVSRFGDEGKMLEIDYSQLEVVVQGLLSLDKNLCKDLIDKIDFHCKRVALKNDISYEDALYWCKDEDAPDHSKWKTERTKCKIFSFQRAYGGGAALIAEETGMDLEEVKQLIQKEDEEYKDIVRFNNSVSNAVESDAEPFRDAQRGFRVFRKGTWQSPTGTMYRWRSYDAPAFLKTRGITDTFKPTELKNYPVQGTGGEIVQIVLGLSLIHI